MIASIKKPGLFSPLLKSVSRFDDDLASASTEKTKIPLPLVGQRGFERKVGEPKQLNYFAARRVSSLALALAMTSSLTFFGQGA